MRQTLIRSALLWTIAVVSPGSASAVAPLPMAGTVVGRIHISHAPLGLLVTPNAVWVSGHHSNYVFRIDPKTNKITGRVDVVTPTDGQPGRMVLAGSKLFEVNYSGLGVVVVNAQTAKTVKVLNGPNENCCWPAYGAGSLWIAGYSSASAQVADRIARIDPSNGHVLAKLRVPDIQGLVYGAGSIWGVSDAGIFRIDPKSNRIVARVNSDAQPFAYFDGSIWAVEPSDSDNPTDVVRINPATNRVAGRIALPAPGGILSTGARSVWVSESFADTDGMHLWKIDPKSNTVVGQVKLGKTAGDVDDVAVSPDGSVWLTLFDHDLLLRVKPT